MDWFFLVMTRLLAATLAGALIGLERDLAGKPAGFRTNILICVGAALFTLASIAMAGGDADRTRIAAQVVSGVGFLGAGAIIRQRGRVSGLTTAATIWAAASLGVAFGAGAFVLGFAGLCLTIVILIGLRFVEQWIQGWRIRRAYLLELDPESDSYDLVKRLVRGAGIRRHSWRVHKSALGVRGRLCVLGWPESIDQLEKALLKEPVVRQVRRV